MLRVCSIVGSVTMTVRKRRASASSSWMNSLYSFSVVAPTMRTSPRASTDLKTLAASDGAPSADPAPIIVCTSSMNRIRLGRSLISRMTFWIRSEEHTSELQSHHPISYAVFCLKKKKLASATAAMTPAAANTKNATVTAITSPTFPPLLRPSIFPTRLPICFFFFNDTATTEIYTGWYTLSLHDALPISEARKIAMPHQPFGSARRAPPRSEEHTSELQSHHPISYAVFCLKKKKKHKTQNLSSFLLTKNKNKKIK